MTGNRAGKKRRALKAVVLAAGRGKRLQSDEADLPKVLRPAYGRPLLAWVLDRLSFLSPADIILVVGYQAEKVRQAFGGQYAYALQSELLGTGHAVAMAAGLLRDYGGDVLVAYGDMPLYSPETFRALVTRHRRTGAACTLLTAITAAHPDYGRIIRGPDGQFAGIVEQKDCTPEQLAIREVNPGVYVFKSPVLFPALARLERNNAQGEYYLTDVPGLLRQDGHKVRTLTIEDDRQIIGVNTISDLAACEQILKEGRP